MSGHRRTCSMNPEPAGRDRRIPQAKAVSWTLRPASGLPRGLPASIRRHVAATRRYALRRGPHVVRPIDVDEAVLGIELDLHHLLSDERVAPDVEHAVRAPHFRRIVVVGRGTVVE